MEAVLRHFRLSGDMAKRGPKEKPVPIDKVEQLARTGMQTEEIAAEMNIHLSTFYKKAEENSEILEAYKRGRTEFLEWVKMTRSQQVLSAYDRLVQEGNPAAVIFGMKAIVGLQETVTHNHTASGNPIANDDRLKELEAKRRMLMQSTEIVIDAKKDDE